MEFKYLNWFILTLLGMIIVFIFGPFKSYLIVGLIGIFVGLLSQILPNINNFLS